MCFEVTTNDGPYQVGRPELLEGDAWAHIMGLEFSRGVVKKGAHTAAARPFVG